MADKKISALDGATTPLAGTEVLPIVQGGSTVKVSVANLTVGRAVAMAGGSFTDNIVQGTAAKGVNFTANTPAAGMTSQLLNSYEEGTWTPTLSTSATDFTSVTYDALTGGRYTKIGNVVYVQCAMRTDAVTIGSASGTVVIKGLPFAAINTGTNRSNYGSIFIGQAYAWGGDTPSEGQIYNGNTRIDLLYRTTSNGASIDLAPSDVGTGADANQIYFSAMYITG